eukprot:4106161-Pyramimonas_sp.AAC.1
MGKRASSNTDTDSAPSAEGPEPYAREAKHFCECKVLHREVRVVVEGVDKYQNIFGTLYHQDSGEPVDLAEHLCRFGLAKVVDWSSAMLSHTRSEKIRLAERAAKDLRLRLWRDYIPPPKTSNFQSDTFSGEVVEIVSGDLIVVNDTATKQERRVVLSSIRAPKVGNARRDVQPERYGLEAKDFLRQRLIGKKVNVSMEYCRTIPAKVEEGAKSADRTMDFGAVTLADESSADGSPLNVAEMLVTRGLATVVQHRAGEERTLAYDALLLAEANAVKNKKGVHSSKEAPVTHINDLSGREATQKARQFLPFLQRVGRVHAVVEVVLSGHRMKLHVPKENVIVTFSLAGVRAPGRGEPFSDEALAFSRYACLQRNAEVEIESVDKTGTFLGTLHVGKLKLSQALLKAGLASLHPMFNVEQSPIGHELQQAEQAAKKARLNMWKDYDPSKEAKSEGENGEAGSGGARVEVWQEVQVTEVKGGGVVYVQRKESAARVDWLAEQLQALNLKESPTTGGVAEVPAPGQVCLAKFSGDNQWYRAKVEKTATTKGTVEVFFLDFGNREEVSTSCVATLELAPQLSLQAQPALAEEVLLAGLKVPKLEEDFGYEAAEMLSDLVMGQTLAVRVEMREKSETKRGRDIVLATIYDPATPTTPSVNAALVQAGVARCVRPHNRRIGAVVDALKPYQEIARASRAALWQYGDVDSDDEM